MKWWRWVGAVVAVAAMVLAVAAVVFVGRGRYEYRSGGFDGVIMYKIDRLRGLEWVSVAGRPWVPIDVEVSGPEGAQVAPWNKPLVTRSR